MLSFASNLKFFFQMPGFKTIIHFWRVFQANAVDKISKSEKLFQSALEQENPRYIQPTPDTRVFSGRFLFYPFKYCFVVISVDYLDVCIFFKVYSFTYFNIEVRFFSTYRRKNGLYKVSQKSSSESLTYPYARKTNARDF